MEVYYALCLKNIFHVIKTLASFLKSLLTYVHAIMCVTVCACVFAHVLILFSLVFPPPLPSLSPPPSPPTLPLPSPLTLGHLVAAWKNTQAARVCWLLW